MNYYNTPINEHRINYVKDVSTLIDNSIPNFKPAWLEIGKYMNNENSRWLSNLNPMIECVGTGHYTILKSLNFIRLSKCKSTSYLNDSDQRFKNIFFHFGLITDCSYQIARCLVLIQSKLDLIKYDEKQLDLGEIKSKVESWYKNYDSRHKEMLKYGISINIEIQPRRDSYFDILDAEEKYTKDYFSFRDSIQAYRNAYIHNPMIDVFMFDGKECVIDTKADKKKSIKINEYRYLSQLDKLDKKFFIHPQELIDRNFDYLLKGLDSLWILYSCEIKRINCNENIDNVLYRIDD
jgi:hypothetical protein